MAAEVVASGGPYAPTKYSLSGTPDAEYFTTMLLVMPETHETHVEYWERGTAMP